MKLLDALVEKSLMTSKKFVATVKAVYSTAEQVQRLAHSILKIAQDVQRHELLLVEIYQINQNLAKNMQESSLDISLPKSKSDIEKKPN
jgi:hypothetical protein